MKIYNAVPAVKEDVVMPGTEDDISVEIFRRFHGVMIDSSSPRVVVVIEIAPVYLNGLLRDSVPSATVPSQ